MLTAYPKRETTRTTYYASPAGPSLDEFTATSALVPPTLKRGRFPSRDKLIASLRSAQNMQSDWGPNCLSASASSLATLHITELHISGMLMRIDPPARLRRG